MQKRIIALVDCDSFFVSCEQADDKGYKNTPTCVISGRNGCVISRSKEAKQLGIKHYLINDNTSFIIYG